MTRQGGTTAVGKGGGALNREGAARKVVQSRSTAADAEGGGALKIDDDESWFCYEGVRGSAVDNTGEHFRLTWHMQRDSAHAPNSSAC